MSRRRLWACGVKQHQGILAPERMRLNDWRRVCVSCSEASGKITYRVCVAAENRRRQKAEDKVLKREARAGEKRVRRLTQKQLDAASWHMCGADLKVVYRDLAKFFTATKSELGGFQQPVFGKTTEHSLGSSSNGFRPVLRVHPGCNRAKLEITIAWRMAYKFDWDGAALHMLRIAEERWGIPEEDLPGINTQGKVDENALLRQLQETLEARSNPPHDPKWLVPALADLAAGLGPWEGVEPDVILDAVGGQPALMASMDDPGAVALDRWTELIGPARGFKPERAA